MKITLCGSIAFYGQMEELRNKLEEKGHEVYIPLLNNEVSKEMGGGKKIYFGQYIEDKGGIDSFNQDHEIWDLKGKAIQAHFEKIEWCDAVLVANYEKKGLEGYIGGNTLIEIGLAFYLKKKIYILNDITSELSYKQEIYGMKPVFLKGSLDI